MPNPTKQNANRVKRSITATSSGNTNQEQVVLAFEKWQVKTNDHIIGVVEEHLMKARRWQDKGIDINPYDYPELRASVEKLIRRITTGVKILEINENGVHETNWKRNPQHRETTSETE
jgi:hypothetical protein